MYFFKEVIGIGNEKKKSNNDHSYKSVEFQHLLDYWTSERLANAQPVPLPRLTQHDLEKFNYNDSQCPPIAQVITIPSSDQESNTTLGTPFEVDVSMVPYKCAGAIFFTTEEGKDYYGTAQIVGHCRIVLTAAHNVRNPETGQYYKNFIFYPRYKWENQSHEIVGFETFKTHPEWIGHNRAFDYAFGRTLESEPEYPIHFTLAIGHQTWQLHGIGYPENYGDGKVMYGVDGQFGGRPNGLLGMKGNPMKDGSSGGAWIRPKNVTDRDKDTFLVVGIHITSSINEEDLAVSPLFDQKTIDLFNDVLDVSRENPRNCSPNSK
ncbi:serine protease [Cytobacillus firmus]|nr:serine protease [Cytobacillus firmus]